MSRFRKLSHTVWHCQYHIIWVPKYRLRIMTGKISETVRECIIVFVEQQGGEVIELNVQQDHVHLLAMVPPKVSISNFVGTIKGRTAIKILDVFRHLKQKPYWGNHFWARGYCVDTVGLNAEMICKYIQFQEAQEKKHEK